MSRPSADFPDPMNASNHGDDDELALGNPDELISQLAGDDIARMLAPDANWQPEPPPPVREPAVFALPAKSPAPSERPVEELTAQLDRIFEEVRRNKASASQAAMTPIADEELEESVHRIDIGAPIADPEPVLVMRRRDEVIDQNDPTGEPRNTLIAPLEEDPLPPALRPLAWLNAPVLDLSAGGRLAVSIVSLLSFVGSVAALTYVLMLRQQG